MNTSRKVGAARLSYKTTVLVDVHLELCYGSNRTCEKSGDAGKHLEVHQWMSVMLCQYCAVMPAWVCGTEYGPVPGVYCASLLVFVTICRHLLDFLPRNSRRPPSPHSCLNFADLIGRTSVFLSQVVRSIRGRFNSPLPFKHTLIPFPIHKIKCTVILISK